MLEDDKKYQSVSREEDRSRSYRRWFCGHRHVLHHAGSDRSLEGVWISFQMQREDLVEFLGSGSIVKNLPAMQERQVQSLGREDPLKKEIATHSRILAQEIPWTEEPGGL